MANVLNADLLNAVNPYITDLGVSLVFGLGYYMVKYMYGDIVKDKKSTGEKTVTEVNWTKLETLEEFNLEIKNNELEIELKINPFEILDVMNKKNICPDIVTYNNLLNTCFIRQNFEEANKLVEEVLDFTSPVQPDLSTYNILLKGISIQIDGEESEKNTDLRLKAESLFTEIIKNANFQPNDVTINTYLDILIKSGEIEAAWDLFDSMDTIFEVKPDKYSYSTIIKALKYAPDESKLERAFGILEYLKQNSNTVANDEIIFNCLIDVCIKLKSMERAIQVFNEMKKLGVQPSKVTYAIIIKGYGQFYQLDAAFEMYEEMKQMQVEPNEVVYGCLVNACVRCMNLKKTIQVVEEMKEAGVAMNIVLYTTLIKAYTKVRKLDKAEEIYKAMLADTNITPNIVVHNAMLDCCVENRDFAKMNSVYELVKQKATEDEDAAQPDLITYSTVIKGYGKAKEISKVMNIFNFLKNETDFSLDEVIYNSVLDACLKNNDFELGFNIFDEMKDSKIPMSNVTYSILIKLLTNTDRIEEALEVENVMRNEGLKIEMIVYTCLIQTAFRNKRFDHAIALFRRMKMEGIRADNVLYNTVINGCLYNFKYDLAFDYTMESFQNNIKIADDIYRNLIERITQYKCNLPQNVKCDYLTKILKELNERNVDIGYETYSKAAKLIYKTAGKNVKVDEYKYQNNNYQKNDYDEKKKYQDNKEGLKSQRKWQRKY